VGFRRAVVLVAMLALCLVALWMGAAGAGASQIAFANAQQGWQTTLEGSRAILWHTADGGVSWTRLQSKPSANGVADGAGPGAGRLAFASATVGLWFWFQPRGRAPAVLCTTDGGRSWKKGGAVDPQHDRASCLLTDAALANSRVGWACTQFCATAGGSIAKTNNAGATWHVQKRITGPDSTGGFWQVVCPTASSCYVLGNGNRLGGLWATADGGKHWARRRLPGGAYWYSIAFPTATTGWAVGHDGRIAKTSNGGLTWTRQASDTSAALYAESFVDNLHGFVVGEYGTVLRTTDGGSSWETLYAGTSASLHEVTFVDGDHGWVYGHDENGGALVLRTTDGGDTWTELP